MRSFTRVLLVSLIGLSGLNNSWAANPPVPTTAVVVEGRTEKVEYDVDGATEYFGFAMPGTATSAAKWKIFRIVTTNNDWELTYADGNSNYDNVFDNRASLTYQ